MHFVKLNPIEIEYSHLHFYRKFCILCFWGGVLCHGSLISPPRIEPVPPALGVQSLKHWTAREVPTLFFFFSLLICIFILLPHKSLKNIFYPQMYFIAYPVIF